MPGPAAVSSAVREYPAVVPVLVDTVTGVTLRALERTDLPAVVEQCRDPDSIRWTNVPQPRGGYRLADAEDWLSQVVAGWAEGHRLSWTVAAPLDGTRLRFCGSIDLRFPTEAVLPTGSGFPTEAARAPDQAEVGFGLHPSARGRSVMSNALRLVRDYAFDVLGLRVLRWRAVVGNWPSRRVAAAAGFRFDGTVRRLLPHRGQLDDGWVATLTADDPGSPLSWSDPPRLTGTNVRLRPFAARDALRIVEACGDLRTRHWLVSLPTPYDESAAAAFLEAAQELAATGQGLVWCVADPDDDRCLGSVGAEGFGGYARRVEIGYWAHPEARGRGVTTEAVRAVTGFLEGERRVDSILIRCAAPNLASRHVAEAAGYRLSGVLPRAEPLGDGTLADLVLYARPYAPNGTSAP